MKPGTPAFTVDNIVGPGLSWTPTQSELTDTLDELLSKYSETCCRGTIVSCSHTAIRLDKLSWDEQPTLLHFLGECH